MAYTETEIWMTTDATGKSPRLPYPDITGLLEPSPEHGGRLVMKPDFVPLYLAAKYRMIRSGDHKLVYKPTAGGPVFELYDVIRDPLEQNDLSAAEPLILERLKSALHKLLLGYRGGFADDF